MSTDTDDGWSVSELLAMGESDARETLTVDEYERWEKLNDLHDEADETRDEWREQEQQVQQFTVRADMEALGTEVELYGNDLLVHLDPEDPEIQRLAEAYDDELGDFDESDFADTDEIPEDIIDTVSELLIDLLDEIIVRWNGEEWADAPRETRRETLRAARESWGVEGMVYGKLEILEAVQEDRDDRMSVIEKFRSPERRGNRGGTSTHGLPDVE